MKRHENAVYLVFKIIQRLSRKVPDFKMASCKRKSRRKENLLQRRQQVTTGRKRFSTGFDKSSTEGGFEHGGRTHPFWHAEIGARFSEAMSHADAFLIGRKIWEIHGGAFEPMAGDPFADTMNNARKYVVSTTLKSTSARRDSTLIRDNIVETVRRLKQEPGKTILVDGSSVLIRELAEHDLIDEYSLHVYPIALGAGKRLFPDGKRINLSLVETAPLPTGVVFMHYRRDA